MELVNSTTSAESRTEDKQPEATTSRFDQVQRVVMLLLGFALIVYLLHEFSTILKHVLISVFLAYLILPAHKWLKGWGLPGFVSYTLILLVTVAAVGGLGFIVYQEARGITDPDRLEELRQETNRFIDQTAKFLPGVEPLTAKEYVNQEAKNALDMGHELLGTFVGFVSQVFIVLVFLDYLLAEQTYLPKRIKRGFKSDRAEHILNAIQKINQSVSRYIAAKTFACFLTGLATTITLFVFGVENAILWGFIAFLSHYIPYLGPAVAVTIPALLSIPYFDNLWMPLLLLFLLNAWQTIIGYFLEPILFGDRLNLSPFVILVSLSFWWSIWGIVGMILAVPLVAVFKIVCEHVPQLRPVSSLLSKA